MRSLESYDRQEGIDPSDLAQSHTEVHERIDAGAHIHLRNPHRFPDRYRSTGTQRAEVQMDRSYKTTVDAQCECELVIGQSSPTLERDGRGGTTTANMAW